MFKLIKKIICFLAIAAILFIVIALWSGGEKFRWFGEKTGGVIKEGSEKLGEKADEIKEKKDVTTRKIKKWSGSKEEPEEESREEPADKVRNGTDKKLKKDSADKSPDKASKKKKESGNESRKDSEEEPAKKSIGESIRELWDKALGKIKGSKG